MISFPSIHTSYFWGMYGTMVVQHGNIWAIAIIRRLVGVVLYPHR